ncbi:MAG TPA: hypothetical protein VGR35_08935 [Tepidisphaeraceae bacterium]|nr:hypothetical protein [Tepidisphaeraceae bacterium]
MMEPDPRETFEDAYGPRRWSARWWFVRFAFSFIALGAVAAYEGWRARERGDSGRASILFVAAAAGIGAGLAGVRMRHGRR